MTCRSAVCFGLQPGETVGCCWVCFSECCHPCKAVVRRFAPASPPILATHSLFAASLQLGCNGCTLLDFGFKISDFCWSFALCMHVSAAIFCIALVLGRLYGNRVFEGLKFECSWCSICTQVQGVGLRCGKEPGRIHLWRCWRILEITYEATKDENGWK